MLTLRLALSLLSRAIGGAAPPSVTDGILLSGSASDFLQTSGGAGILLKAGA